MEITSIGFHDIIFLHDIVKVHNLFWNSVCC